MAEEKEKKKILKKLQNKYRLVLMHDETFEERNSWVLSPLSVFTLVSSATLLLIIVVVYVVAFTPMRELIPGYTDPTLRREAISLAITMDSMQNELRIKDAYLNNIRNIMLGKDTGEVQMQKDTIQKYEKLNLSAVSKQDSAMRKMIESQDKYSLNFTTDKTSKSDISSFFFFTPLNGMVSNSFNTKEKHFGVDIVAPKNEAIKAVLDGTVILSCWTSDGGYVIQLQHDNNLVSIYKHNSAVLKKEGAFVKAGEAIAIIGNSGELTTGPHLHLELWYNGNAINPQDYMRF
jgi:murein DD-endopeptidase MepM/ murein hydrolase activator NlpD